MQHEKVQHQNSATLISAAATSSATLNNVTLK